MNTLNTNWVRILSVAVFSVSFVLGMALVAWYEITEVTDDTALATVIAIIVKGQAVSVVSAGLAAVIEGGAYIVVIANHLMQKERERGIAEGIAIGHSKGHAEGRTEGSEGAYEDAARQNEAYYKRMLEAREKGEDFNEPPPTFNRNGR